MMEIFIETLTGAAFELRVSPFETILSVKAKIQRLEGIPVSQQHLIWQTLELDDDYCLHDYGIQDGTTLKLVLAMRGGPINTRRVPMEDPALREMADYMEANRDELIDKLPNNRQVTLLVYREGDQLNFFRVVDRGDGTLTPLSESYSGNSVYNLYDEEEEEVSQSYSREEENDQMKEKIKLLRAKMENFSIGKKPKIKKKLSPQPPPGRPKSRTRHHFAVGRSKHPMAPYDVIPKSYVSLPPVKTTSDSVKKTVPVIAATSLVSQPVTQLKQYRDKSTLNLTQQSSSNPILGPIKPVLKNETRPKSSSVKKTHQINANTDLPTSSQESGSKCDNNLTDIVRPHTSTKKRDAILETVNESQPFPPPNLVKSPDRISNGSSKLGSKSIIYNNETVKSPSHTSSKHTSERKQGLLLESLSSQEARGLLRQASLERLGSSKLPPFGRSSTKSRNGYSLPSSGERIYTPDGRRSGRLRRSAGRDACLSPRLPPVKQKKKNVKRCFLCAKKTGLATSYQCRCGNNFCASHRYAETHGCTFDYKSEGRKLLEQGNPVINAPKLPKI